MPCVPVCIDPCLVDEFCRNPLKVFPRFITWGEASPALLIFNLLDMFRFYAASWAHRSLPNFVLYQTSLCFDVLCSRVVKRTYETLLHIKIGLRSKVCHLLAKTSGGAYACMGQERGSWSVLHIVLFSGRFWVKPYPYKAKKG